ncbi:MAG: protein kinase [Chloroflexi bacterium]|nr:protein kinase [Chloroflexota bacterium]
MTLRPGTTIAGYRIVSLLGRGGMGEVYEATDIGLGRTVAVKVLPIGTADEGSARERFLVESRLAASLDHPHIVPIFEAGEYRGQPFIAMRFVDGVDLATLIDRDGPMALERAVELLAGVADALDAAHAKGLIHRDVKPENILIASTPRGDHAYLADFGLGTRLGSGGPTVAGQVLGSVDFVAPEQIEGMPVSAAADIYSLAGVLFACVTGHPPFPSTSAMAALWSHVQAPPPRPSTRRRELTGLDPVIARGLAKRPTDRPDSAGSLILEARQALTMPATEAAPAAAGPNHQRAEDRPSRGPQETHSWPGLPAPIGAFIGRAPEIAEVEDLIQRSRLVTILGPGGVGKTRLAIAAAQAVARSFDRVGFLDLSPVRDAAALPTVILDWLGVPSDEEPFERQVATALGNARLLLVVDNVEQVVQGAPVIASCLTSAAGLTIVATSRVPLSIRGEQEFLLGPLALPPTTRNAESGSVDVDDVAASDAVRLFMAEVNRHHRTPLTRANAAAVAEICRRLDGLPLALEVVAARSRMLSIPELLDRLEFRIDLPAADSDVPIRQRTLRSAIAWSVDLLSPATRRVFVRVGVFVGGFTAGAAAALDANEGVEDQLEELARHSLIVRHPGGRFGMLETIREFALDELRAIGGEREVRLAQIAWLHQLIRAVDQAFVRGSGQTAALEAAEPERANVRDAMHWAGANGAEHLALQLASAKNFWGFRGMGGEVRAVLEDLLGDLLGRSIDYDEVDVANARTTLASIHMRAGELERAAGEFAAARDQWAALGDHRKVAVVENNLSIVAERQDDFGAAREHLERALTVMRGLDDRPGTASIVGNLGVLALRLGDLLGAAAFNSEALAIARELGDEEIAATGLTNLADIAMRRDRPDEARPLLAEGLEICVRLDDAEGIATCLELAAQIAAADTHPDDAARLLAGAERIRAESAFVRSPAEEQAYQKEISGLLDRLGLERYALASAEGAALPSGPLVDLARHQLALTTSAAGNTSSGA